MIFITFHNKNTGEIKLRLDSIIGFRTYNDGSHAVLVVGETENPIFVDEDWEFFESKVRLIEQAEQNAVRDTLLGNRVIRKFNGQDQ